MSSHLKGAVEEVYSRCVAGGYEPEFVKNVICRAFSLLLQHPDGLSIDAILEKTHLSKCARLAQNIHSLPELLPQWSEGDYRKAMKDLAELEIVEESGEAGREFYTLFSGERKNAA